MQDVARMLSLLQTITKLMMSKQKNETAQIGKREWKKIRKERLKITCA